MSPWITLQLLQVPGQVAQRLLDRIPSEFLYERASEDESHHGLPNHARGRHCACVRSLMLSQERLLGDHIHGSQGLLEWWDRFEIPHHADVFAIRDPAFDSAG